MSAETQVFHVGGTWEFNEPPDDAALRLIGSVFAPDDETFCFWAHDDDRRLVESSWDMEASSVEDAARRCKSLMDRAQKAAGFVARLAQIGVGSDEAYAKWTDPKDEDDLTQV